MGLTLTDATVAALSAATKQPNLVFKIQGVPTIYGTSVIMKMVRIGDGSVIGDPTTAKSAYYIGGQNAAADQQNAITVNGTSTSIKQTLDPSKGQGTSVSTLSMALIDDGSITELVTPGKIVTDILQRKCKVYFGFASTNYPEDYMTVFRGFITEVALQPGLITFQINGTDEKERTNIFKRADLTTTTAITQVQTSITLVDVASILTGVKMPDGSVDPSFRSYVKIDDEFIEYTGVSGSTLTGCVRGSLGSTAAAHDASTSAQTFYRLVGNGIDLALKLMASGNTDDSGNVVPFDNAVPVTSINVGGAEYNASSLFFQGLDVADEYGVTVGDWINVTDPSNAANTKTGVKIVDIIKGVAGDFIVINTTLADNNTSPNITCGFISQYATLPDGCLMQPDEIDVDEHVRIRRMFLSSATYDFYIQNGIDNAREFLEQNVYMPLSAYSLPRKSRASVGYHIGPIPGSTVQTFDETNIKKPNDIRIKRGTNSNFWNEIIYKYDLSATDDSTYLSGYIAVSEFSKDRILNAPNRTLVIEAKGLRTNLDAVNIIQDQSARRLERYQYGAETFTFSTSLAAGFAVEIGDILLFDGTNLQLPDIRTGQKGLAPRLLEVQNKDFQLKTGDIKFTAVDTNFDGAARYGLMSPSSNLAAGSTSQYLALTASYAQQYGAQEYKKWSQRVGYGVRVRKSDYTVVGMSIIDSVSTNNVVKLRTPLTFTPDQTFVLELVKYTDATATAASKLIYASFPPAAGFADGSNPYVML